LLILLHLLTAVLLQPAQLAMSMRETLQMFRMWSERNKFKSFLVIVGCVYIMTFPLLRPLVRMKRSSLPTAEERAAKPEIRSEVRGS